MANESHGFTPAAAVAHLRGYGRRTPRRLRLRLLAMDGLTERRATLRAALAFLALEPREPERRLLHRGREAAAGGRGWGC